MLYLCNLCNTDYFESVKGSGGSILYVFSFPTKPKYMQIKNFIKTKKKKKVKVMNFRIIVYLWVLLMIVE